MATKTTKIGRYTVEDSWGNYNPEEDIIARDLALYELRAVKTILDNVKRVEPEVMKYARKALGLGRIELGELFEVNEETISRWENEAEHYEPSIQLALLCLINNALSNNGELSEVIFNYTPETAPKILNVK